MGGLSAFATSLPGFLRGKLMRGPFRMGGPAAFAGNLALLGPVHCCKSTRAFFCHRRVPFMLTLMRNEKTAKTTSSAAISFFFCHQIIGSTLHLRKPHELGTQKD
jgi:hypothetical protein